MNFIDINENKKLEFNKLVNHPLQTYEWGEFRKKTGVNIIRRTLIKNNEISNPYQITIHKTPKFPYKIGYLPKGYLPNTTLLQDLKLVGEENSISFVQLEPDVLKKNSSFNTENLKKSFHPLFTRFTFILDLTKPEDILLKSMHQKTRYNIKLSNKKGVKTEIDNSEKAFNKYLELTRETTKRQKFYAHNEKYHKLMWETLRTKENEKYNPNKLQAHLLKATYENQVLVTYILFTFKDRLFYPYGASSSEHRNLMPSHAAMWGAIRFGKSLGLKIFDMWGAANVKEPEKTNPYYGFHKFKEGFGTELVEFVGSYDYVINPINYRLLTVADKIRWAYLRARKN